MTNPTDLKNIGLKATLPRLKILEIFQHSPVRHLTAEDVYRNLLHEELDIGLATVYRVLTQFEQAGLLTRSNFESGKAVFAGNEGTALGHVVGIDCGPVEELFAPEIQNRKQAIEKERGFKLPDNALGLC